MLWVHHDGPRVAHLPLDESLPGLRSLLQPGNADGLFGSIVGPVEVTTHPVNCYPLHCVNT